MASSVALWMSRSESIKPTADPLTLTELIGLAAVLSYR